MKRHPEFQKERQRLLLRREEYKQLIHSDVHEIKQSLRPLSVAKDIIGNVVGNFRHNGIAAQGSILALRVLPGRWLRRPLVGMAVSVLLPLLLRNLPGILDFVRGKTSQGGAKAKILGQMKNAVSQLRKSIHAKS